MVKKQTKEREEEQEGDEDDRGRRYEFDEPRRSYCRFQKIMWRFSRKIRKKTRIFHPFFAKKMDV